jgi:hypothetical protein
VTEVPFTGDCPTCLGCGHIDVPASVDAGSYTGQDFDLIPCPTCQQEAAPTLQVEAA